MRADVADRIERWMVPVVRWVRRTLWLPVGAGGLAVVLGVVAVLVWRGLDGDGFALAVLVGGAIVAPTIGVALFVRLLGELERLPATVRAVPENAGALKGELVTAGVELSDLRRSGLLGLPGALGWLRRTLRRMDALGVAGVAAAVAALHPLRLAWILLLSALALVALPVAAAALLLVLVS
jgi:hypothetical protein